MASSNPSPILSIILFLIFTIFYFIAKFQIKKSSKEKSSEEKYLNMILSTYLLINILSQLFVNVSITNQLCGVNQWYTATIMTLLPWIMIFSLIVILLLIFPGWLAPFSSTFGYGITKLGGINKIFSEILVSKDKMMQNIKDENNSELSAAIQGLFTNESLLLNEISSKNFENTWKYFKTTGIFSAEANDSSKNKLREMVILKETISEFIWYMLSGIFTISASYNYVISSSCQTSTEAAKARYQQYEEDIQQQNENQESAPEQRVYASYE